MKGSQSTTYLFLKTFKIFSNILPNGSKVVLLFLDLFENRFSCSVKVSLKHHLQMAASTKSVVTSEQPKIFTKTKKYFVMKRDWKISSSFAYFKCSETIINLFQTGYVSYSPNNPGLLCPPAVSGSSLSLTSPSVSSSAGFLYSRPRSNSIRSYYRNCLQFDNKFLLWYKPQSLIHFSKR